MKTVLNRMLRAEFITEEEYNEAIEYDIVADFIEPESSPTEKYGYLTAELEERAAKIIKEHLLEEDGYTLEDVLNDEKLNDLYTELVNRALRINNFYIYMTII